PGRLAGGIDVEVTFHVLGTPVGTSSDATYLVANGQRIQDRSIVARGDVGPGFHIPANYMLQQGTRLDEPLRPFKRDRIVAIQRIGNTFAPIGVEITPRRAGERAGGEKFRLKVGEELAHDAEATRQDRMEMITLRHPFACMWRLRDVVPIEKDHFIEEIGS